jgi:hypothetical protein
VLLQKYTITRRLFIVRQSITRKLTPQLNIVLRPRPTTILSPFIAHQQSWQIPQSLFLHIHQRNTAPILSLTTTKKISIAPLSLAQDFQQLTIPLNIVKRITKHTTVSHSFARNFHLVVQLVVLLAASSSSLSSSLQCGISATEKRQQNNLPFMSNMLLTLRARFLHQ